MTILPAVDQPDEIRAYVEGIHERDMLLADEAISDRAQSRRRKTLEDLHAELRFVARASRFVAMPEGSDDEPDPLTERYRLLLPKLMAWGGMPAMAEKHAAVLYAAYRENFRSGAFDKAWGKKNPRTWLGSLKLDAEELRLPAAEELPGAVLSRAELRRLLWNTVDPKLSALLVLAWGEMRADHAREFLKAPDEVWVPLISRLRASELTREAAYEAFRELAQEKSIPNLGPAYYTKLIYFLRYPDPNDSDTGFIMDQWTANSINLVFGSQIVKLDAGYVSGRNQASDYELFNRLIEYIAFQWRARVEHVEMTLFGQGGKGGGDIWRRNVRASMAKAGETPPADDESS